MTITRAQLRRNIARRARQPFHLRYGDYATMTSAGGSNTAICTTIKEADDKWINAWMFVIDTLESFQVTDWASSGGTFTLLPNPASTFSGTETFELFAHWSAEEIHDAINAALRNAWPYFFTIEEGEIVISSNIGVDYSLSTLSPTVYSIAGLYLEVVARDYSGTVTSASGDKVTINDSNAAFTSDDVGAEIRIYSGDYNVGESRTITTVSSATQVVVSTAFTSNIDTSMSYRLVDVLDATHGWQGISNWRPNSPNNPTEIHLGHHPTGYEGYKIRVVYEALYPALTTETGATSCPQEFVELSALAHLFLGKMLDSPSSELRNWAAAQQAFAEAAEAYGKLNAYQHAPRQFYDDHRSLTFRPTDYPF